MAEAQKGGKTEAAVEPKVTWNDAEMVSGYANVCNACSTREEIMVFFGTNQTWNPTQNEVSIKLTNRIVMSPFAAKRMNLILANVINEYEANFGIIDLDGQTVTADQQAQQPN